MDVLRGAHVGHTLRGDIVWKFVRVKRLSICIVFASFTHNIGFVGKSRVIVDNIAMLTDDGRKWKARAKPL